MTLFLVLSAIIIITVFAALAMEDNKTLVELSLLMIGALTLISTISIIYAP